MKCQVISFSSIICIQNAPFLRYSYTFHSYLHHPILEAFLTTKPYFYRDLLTVVPYLFAHHFHTFCILNANRSLYPPEDLLIIFRIVISMGYFFIYDSHLRIFLSVDVVKEL